MSSASVAARARYRPGSPTASGTITDAVRSPIVASGPTLISRAPPKRAYPTIAPIEAYRPTTGSSPASWA